jgi:hypothetical protein
VQSVQRWREDSAARSGVVSVPAGGVPLGVAPPPSMPEVTVYPVAAAFLCGGNLPGTSSTHYLRIVVPALGREVHVPFGGPAIARMARDFGAAAEQERINTQTKGGKAL